MSLSAFDTYMLSLLPIRAFRLDDYGAVPSTTTATDTSINADNQSNAYAVNGDNAAYLRVAGPIGGLSNGGDAVNLGQDAGGPTYVTLGTCGTLGQNLGTSGMSVAWWMKVNASFTQLLYITGSGANSTFQIAINSAANFSTNTDTLIAARMFGTSSHRRAASFTPTGAAHRDGTWHFHVMNFPVPVNATSTATTGLTADDPKYYLDSSAITAGAGVDAGNLTSATWSNFSNSIYAGARDVSGTPDQSFGEAGVAEDALLSRFYIFNRPLLASEISAAWDLRTEPVTAPSGWRSRNFRGRGR